MDIEITARLPQWYSNLDNKSAIITGDIDSLMGYYMLRQRFDIYINGFYDFNALYLADTNEKDMFGVDLDSLHIPSFGNHITHFHKNYNAVNLNNIFDIKYHQKFPFSTTLLVLALYGFGLESFSDEQLKIVLAIDCGFKGYYSKPYFKEVYIEWLDKLDIRFLEDRVLSTTTKEELYNVIQEYNLAGNIRVDTDGYLQTDIDLDAIGKIFDDRIDLPIYPFQQVQKYQYEVINPYDQSIPNKKDIFSMAWTDTNTLKMSLQVA